MSDPSAILSHRYFMSSDYSAGRGTIELPPPPWQKSLHSELRYPYDVLEQALPQVRARGLHFYFTKNAYRLPEYGPHVVSVLLQEERCKVPVYGKYILATIRNLMPRPFLGWRPHPRIGRVEAVLTFEYTRDWYTHLRSRVARAFPPAIFGAPIRREPLSLRIPLGYHSQVELPYIPIKNRPPRHVLRRRGSPPRPQKRLSTLDLYLQVRGPRPALARAGKDQERLAHRSRRYRLHRQQEERAGLQYLLRKNDEHPHLPRSPRQPFPTPSATSRACAPAASSSPTRPGRALPLRRPHAAHRSLSEIRGILQKYGRNDDFIEEMGHKARAWWDSRCTPELLGRYIATELNKGALPTP